MRGSLATVLIPAKDEERWIDDCLASVVAQDYPHHLLEVIVAIDGASTDGTGARAKELLDSSNFARGEVVCVAGRGTPGNLNAGLTLARGEVLCRVDARSRIPSDYVRRCVQVLTERDDVMVVGGAQVAIPSRDDSLGWGIARALNNRWGLGLSRYRRGASSGPTDTVYLGAFRTADLRTFGGWRVDLATNQDFELNRRLGRHGTVWFDASLAVQYLPRPDLRTLYQQYRRFGAWKVRYWKLTGDQPRPRQVALAAGAPSLALAAVATLAFGSRRQRRFACASIAAAAALVEFRGSAGPRGGPAVHASSALALGAIGFGWLRGVWGQLLAR